MNPGPRMRLLSSPVCLCSMLWATVALRVTRFRLRRAGLRASVPSSTRIPTRGEPGVLVVLNRVDRTCLERSLVLQRWLADHGRPFDVLIGVKAQPDARAHAWLDTEDPDGFSDLYRIPPPASRARHHAS